VTPGVRSVDGHSQTPVTAWEAQATPPGEKPDERRWADAEASVGRRSDGEDWWFRASLPKVDAAETALVFGGLATLAEVWVDGEARFQSDNMFVQRETPAGAEVRVRCRALDFGTKRPRPRWRVPMMENQQLRWFRTTLLGRTPGWSPPHPVVGPWRPVHVEARSGFAVDDVQLTVRGNAVDAACTLRPLDGKIQSVQLVVGEHRVALSGDGAKFSGRLELAQPERWWPHTHGQPHVHPAQLDVDGRKVDLGVIGFRELVRDGDFGVTVNGVPVFARGACWTPLDVQRLTSPREKLETALLQAREAGMNMLRVGGTMVYESDDFYDLCDRLGILVWQDFMFANMDYPEDDPTFAKSVDEEVRQIVARLRARPSVAVYCGNSEGEQQAAMWGAPRERWTPKLFHQTLPSLVEGIYWPSSAHGGDFPHQANRGTTSYYGVGAYLRPLDDARRSEVRFASECLAFANIPRTVPPTLRVHHPAWKDGTPRDLGAGWDFDDVRDHYVKELFRVDPAALRYSDHERYLALGRVATGEVLAQTFGEWRRARSTCRGALVWFLRDLRSGAGWGVVGSDGAPKPAWYYLKRALQPLALHLSDEGVNGVTLHVANDGAPFTAEINITCWRQGEVKVAEVRRSVDVGAALELPLAQLFDGFHDLSWAYRFGPPAQDLIVATLNGIQAFYFPAGLPNSRELDVGLSAELREDELVVRTRRFAQSVAVELEGCEPDDNYFHLAPGSERIIKLRGRGRGTLQPLNAETAARIK
jgi:beta-mannosidase